MPKKNTLLIMTWLWRQPGSRCEYNAEHVNTWAAMVSRNLTIPHRLACVTDMPEGIEIDTIPLPQEFDRINSAAWDSKHGLPQCYRRLVMFSPDAERIFGARRFVSMDLDCVVSGNIDHLFQRDDGFVMFRGTAAKRPYNGSMLMMTAGSRPQVYQRMVDNPGAVVRDAQSRYLGSDQAVISHILGPDEAVWDKDDGVYFWSPRFKRDHKGRPPTNMCLLFFPGNPKPWDALEYPYIRRHWHSGEPHDKPDRLPSYGGNTLYFYRDRKGWGRRLMEAAKKKGLRTRMFMNPRSVPPGSRAYVRMDQQGEMRRTSKRVHKVLCDRDCILIPSASERDWYDDKVAQYEVLKPWIIDTFITEDKSKAREHAASAKYPFVSKLSEGASSKNVILVEDQQQALQIIEQQDYVYWQKLASEHDGDYRVTVIGDYIAGLRRRAKLGDFRASGSGDFDYLDWSDPKAAKCAALAIEISEALGINCVAFDFVINRSRPKVLEMSSSWHWESCINMPLYTHDLEPADLTGRDVPGIIVDMMVAQQ